MDNEFGNMRILRRYIPKDEKPEIAILDLQAHLVEFNRKYDLCWSLVLPKRSKRKSAVIGKASDNNHLLYQELLDGILSECPNPLTTETIRLKLIDLGEKPSTARMIAGDYFRLIVKVLNPNTKLHRGAGETLAKWMEF